MSMALFISMANLIYKLAGQVANEIFAIVMAANTNKRW